MQRKEMNFGKDIRSSRKNKEKMFAIDVKSLRFECPKPTQEENELNKKNKPIKIKVLPT